MRNIYPQYRSIIMHFTIFLKCIIIIIIIIIITTTRLGWQFTWLIPSSTVDALLLFCRYGRKIVMFSTIAIHTVFSLCQVLSPSWALFCALFFLVGMGANSNYVSAFVIGTLSLTYPDRPFGMWNVMQEPAKTLQKKCDWSIKKKLQIYSLIYNGNNNCLVFCFPSFLVLRDGDLQPSCENSLLHSGFLSFLWFWLHATSSVVILYQRLEDASSHFQCTDCALCTILVVGANVLLCATVSLLIWLIDRPIH